MRQAPDLATLVPWLIVLGAWRWLSRRTHRSMFGDAL
jgi:hypothetical protein